MTTISTARRLGRPAVEWGRGIWLGVVAGMLAGAAALVTAIWFVTFHGLAGPIEIAIGSIPLAWALVSAAIVGRHADRGRSRS